MFCSLKKISLEEDTWMIQSDIKQGDTRCIEKKKKQTEFGGVKGEDL